MVRTMTKHVMERHPDTAKERERMHTQEPRRWGAEIRPKWEAKGDE